MRQKIVINLDQPATAGTKPVRKRRRWPRVLGLGLGLLGVALNVSWTRAQSQADAKPPAFEVASVRPNRSGEGRVAGGFQPGGRYHVTNYSLRALIAAAYLRPQVNPDFLIAGGR